MAKPAGKVTTWISLHQARDHVAQVYLSTKYAERWIADRLAAGDLPWRAKAVIPPGHPTDKFWQGPPSQVAPSINWTENSARRSIRHVDVPGVLGVFEYITLVGIEVALEGLTPAEVAPPAPEKGRGGSPGFWDWPDLAARLPDIGKKTPFEDRPAFEQWCQMNVRRTDGKPRGDGPDITTVRRAIAKHHLEIPGLFKPF